MIHQLAPGSARKRIAIIHPGMDVKGGAENVTLWLANGLGRRGYDLTLITDSFDKDLWPADLTRDLKVVSLPGPLVPIRSNRLRRWGSLLFLAISIRNVDWVVGQQFPTYSWATAARALVGGRWKVLWLCPEPNRRLYFDVTDIHAQNWRSLVRAGVENEHLDRVVESRTKIRPGRRRRMNRDRRLDHESVQLCDRIFANSEFTVDNIRAIFGVDSSVCRLGVPFPADRPYVHGDYIGVLTALSPLKNVHNTIRAVHALISRPGCEDLKLKIAGDGPEREILERMVAERGLEERVDFIGYLEDKDLAAFFRGARFMVYCPVDEPLGLVPIEALAAGTPSVVSDHGGPAETIANGKVGLHANPLDPESIADAAERLWRDTELTRRLGNAGNDLVRKLYTLDGFIDRFETMLFDDAKRSI